LAVALSMSRASLTSLSWVSQLRLASIISTSAVVAATFEPSIERVISRASGSSGRMPSPLTRNRPSRPLTTSDPVIHAIGECAEHRGACYGLVEPAYQQAAVLARHLAGKPAAYEGTVPATNLKVSGVPVFSAGDFLGAAGTESIVWRDPGLATYRKLVLQDGALAGAILCGETADAPWYLDLIRSGRPLGPLRDGLIFGQALAKAA